MLDLANEVAKLQGHLVLSTFRQKSHILIDPTGRKTRRALEKGEKYCPLSKTEVKTK